MGRVLWLMAALVAGLLTGAAARSANMGLGAILVADTVGGIWVDLLRMTIVPLVVSLLVAGMAGTGAGGALAGRALRLFVLLLVASSAVSALLVPLLLGSWTPSPEVVAALRAALPEGSGAAPPLSPLDWLRALVPANVVAAAAEGALVPLVIFALLLGLAARGLEAGQRDRLVGTFEALAAAMQAIVGWVLRAAPVGVFALAFALGARTGLGLVASLAWYVTVIAVICLLLIAACVALAAVKGVAPGRFLRAVAPAQAVAFSTQSSLATLPLMVEGAGRLRVPAATSGVVLPLAVATFRISAPVGIIALTLTLTRLYGLDIGVAQIATVAALAAVCSLLIGGVPGQASYFAANAPAALAVGLPFEALPLLLAIDVIPDMFRTTLNVTGDVTVAVLLAEREAVAGPETPA